jgi:hypothetical protein
MAHKIFTGTRKFLGYLMGVLQQPVLSGQTMKKFELTA